MDSHGEARRGRKTSLYSRWVAMRLPKALHKYVLAKKSDSADIKALLDEAASK